MKTLPCKFFALVLLLTASFMPSCFTQQPAVADNEHVEVPVKITTVSPLASDILSYINKYRQTKGLSALISNTAITEQAARHSADMATKKVAFSHAGFETRIKNISKSIGTLRSSAENVAFGELSARQVVDLWLKSPGHRKNIEGKFELTGIGFATAPDGNVYFTQIFASK